MTYWSIVCLLITVYRGNIEIHESHYFFFSCFFLGFWFFFLSAVNCDFSLLSVLIKSGSSSHVSKFFDPKIASNPLLNFFSPSMIGLFVCLFNTFIYLFMAALGLRCCVRAFSS